MVVVAEAGVPVEDGKNGKNVLRLMKNVATLDDLTEDDRAFWMAAALPLMNKQRENLYSAWAWRKLPRDDLCDFRNQ